MELVNFCGAPECLLRQFSADTPGAWWNRHRRMPPELLAIQRVGGIWAVVIRDPTAGPRYLGGEVQDGPGWRIDSPYLDSLLEAMARYMAAIARLNT